MTRCNRLAHSLSLRLLPLLAALLVAASIPACKREAEEADASEATGAATEVPREKTSAEVEDERRRLHETQLTERLNKLDQRRMREPQKYAEHVRGYNDVLDVAQETSLLPRIQAALKELRASVERAAEQSLEKVYVQTTPFIAEEKYEEARQLLLDWDPSPFVAFPELDALGLRDKKVEDIERRAAARDHASTVLRMGNGFKSQQDFAKAVAILESFPDRYADTPYYKEVRDLLKDCYERYLTEKQSEVQEETVAWTALDIDSQLTNFRTRAVKDVDKVWQVDKEEGEDVIAGNNETEDNAQLMIGDSSSESWQEYILEFDVRIGDGEKELKLGVGQRELRGMKQRQFSMYRVPLAGGNWYKIAVWVQGGKLRVNDVDGSAVLLDAIMMDPSGGAAILLMPGDKASIRNVRCKILAKLEKAPEAEAKPESDGKKEGKKKKKKPE